MEHLGSSLLHCTLAVWHLALAMVRLTLFVALVAALLIIGYSPLATIGLFNIIGAISSGLLGSRFPKRYLLSIIYTLRAIAIAADAK